MFTYTVLFALTAQFASFNGEVRDAKTHRAIPLAKIELQHTLTPVGEEFTTTDGRFEFPPMASGRYGVLVSAAGYQTVSLEIDVLPTSFPTRIELVPRRTSPTPGQLVIPLSNYLVPKGARKEFDRARSYARQQECPKAIKHFQSGLQIFNKDAAAYTDLGNCFRAMGQLEQAENAFKHAAQLSNSIYISLDLADVYIAQRRFTDAEVALLETIRRQSNAGDAYYGLAIVYFNQGLFEDAEITARQAHQHSHRIADVHLLLAKIYWKQQRLKEVVQQLELYIGEAPNGEHSARVREILNNSAQP